jgi:hypothetical protein
MAAAAAATPTASGTASRPGADAPRGPSDSAAPAAHAADPQGECGAMLPQGSPATSGNAAPEPRTANQPALRQHPRRQSQRHHHPQPDTSPPEPIRSLLAAKPGVTGYAASTPASPPAVEEGHAGGTDSRNRGGGRAGGHNRSAPTIGLAAADGAGRTCGRGCTSSGSTVSATDVRKASPARSLPGLALAVRLAQIWSARGRAGAPSPLAASPVAEGARSPSRQALDTAVPPTKPLHQVAARAQHQGVEGRQRGRQQQRPPGAIHPTGGRSGCTPAGGCDTSTPPSRSSSSSGSSSSVASREVAGVAPNPGAGSARPVLDRSLPAIPTATAWASALMTASATTQQAATAGGTAAGAIAVTSADGRGGGPGHGSLYSSSRQYVTASFKVRQHTRPDSYDKASATEASCVLHRIHVRMAAVDLLHTRPPPTSCQLLLV